MKFDGTSLCLDCHARYSIISLGESDVGHCPGCGSERIRKIGKADIADEPGLALDFSRFAEEMVQGLLAITAKAPMDVRLSAKRLAAWIKTMAMKATAGASEP